MVFFKFCLEFFKTFYFLNTDRIAAFFRVWRCNVKGNGIYIGFLQLIYQTLYFLKGYIAPESQGDNFTYFNQTRLSVLVYQADFTFGFPEVQFLRYKFFRNRFRGFNLGKSAFKFSLFFVDNFTP
ncbi:hypothetical protein dsmv_3788 [Desulfococcus multivorans DSM 2059]|uniref:Uncharacterized protein n=1 Tax=Desulfococcus multivorans DSM 2059 TaxID=1121405 RepID=S7U6U1_DESML|nr:hypothetical protein dsmv_3788 [Desulfococcus multivorans DSM 2059]SKA29040.1 hypothetical protein SAMN02745446_03817 [Desulfococcus multivorans DSM 2059]